VSSARWSAINDGEEFAGDGENGLGNSVFDGDITGSKRGPSQIHLGDYRNSGRSRGWRAVRPGGAQCAAMFGND